MIHLRNRFKDFTSIIQEIDQRKPPSIPDSSSQQSTPSHTQSIDNAQTEVSAVSQHKKDLFFAQKDSFTSSKTHHHPSKGEREREREEILENV